LGRVAGADIVLADDPISRRHCHIARTGNDYLLEDRYSTGGTFVNDERCSSRVLVDGDVVSLGACKMRFMISNP
jgi:pSer/pThr/pTyr-binding forkhead associated (FHA) protein